MRKGFVFTLIAIFLLSLSGIALAQLETKIGYVNLSKAFDEYGKTKDLDKELETKGEAKQKEREGLVKDIRKMREEIELLNEKARAEKEEDIETSIRTLQEFDQNAKADLTKERDDMVRDILKEMNRIIQEYGEANGFSIIINDRVLLYGDKAQDLTDTLIKILNDNYKKK